MLSVTLEVLVPRFVTNRANCDWLYFHLLLASSHEEPFLGSLSELPDETHPVEQVLTVEQSDELIGDEDLLVANRALLRHAFRLLSVIPVLGMEIHVVVRATRLDCHFPLGRLSRLENQSQQRLVLVGRVFVVKQQVGVTQRLDQENLRDRLGRIDLGK